MKLATDNILGYVTDEVSTIDIFECNLNEENRIKWITDLAAVSRGKDESKNPEKRFKVLLKEAAPNSCDGDCKNGVPSRPFEFGLVVIGAKEHKDNIEIINIETSENVATIDKEVYYNNLLPFSYSVFENEHIRLYTNLRALVNAGIPYEKIPYNNPETIKAGKPLAIKSYTPMFSWAQDKTHCLISSESASGRIVPENDYWLPEDLVQKCIELHNDKIGIVDFNILLENVKQERPDLEGEELHYFTEHVFIDLIENPTENKFFLPVIAVEEWSPKEFADFLVETWTQEQVQRFFKFLGYKKEIYDRAMYYFRYKLMIRCAWGIDPKRWQHYFLERNATEQWSNWTQDYTKEVSKKIREIYLSKYVN